MNHTAVRTPEASTRPCPALVRQHLQDRTVAIAAGREFHGADVGRGGIHGQMDLAPPASALHPMLARPPLSIAEKPDAGAVNQQVQGAIGAPMRHLDGERLLPTAQGRVVGTAQSIPANFSRLATIPAVCRSGNLNRTLMVSPNSIAASENNAGRPGRPSCGASQVISLSSRISSDPRLRSDAVSLDQFVVR